MKSGFDFIVVGIFRSLLYEACGRIVNPIYGSVGLLWSGNWQLCQNAVEAVLKGAPITSITSDAAETHNGPPLKPYDIRHVIKNENAAAASNDLRRLRVRPKFKRSAAKAGRVRQVSGDSGDDDRETNYCRSTSHDSSLSHQSEAVAPSRDVVSQLAVEETETAAAETPDDNLVVVVVERLNNKESSSSSSSSSDKKVDDGEIELELTLGFEPLSRTTTHITKPKGIKRSRVMTVDSATDDNDNDYQDCRMELGLDIQF